jgi:chaperone modulatory protein CbpM
LIRDLRDDFGVNDEGVSIVLDLIDQVHGLRRTLRELMSSTQTQAQAPHRRTKAAPARTRSPTRNPDRSSQ